VFYSILFGYAEGWTCLEGFEMVSEGQAKKRERKYLMVSNARYPDFLVRPDQSH
jgi:hypothetical protein